jgi:ATP-dependent RNA helicase DeaD
MDIAAAAVKMAHSAAGGNGDTQEIIAPQVPVARGRPERGERGERRERDERGVEQGMTRLFVGAGKKAGIRPADLVGAIAGESGVPSSVIGAIRIAENFSVVDVPEDLADAIIGAVGAATLRGKRVRIRRDRND